MRRPILHALVPGLLDSVSRWAKGYGKIARYAGIEALLGESSRHLFPAQGIEATLCALLELAATTCDDLPLGELRRYGFGGDADTAHGYVRTPFICAPMSRGCFCNTVIGLTSYGAKQIGLARF